MSPRRKNRGNTIAEQSAEPEFIAAPVKIKDAEE
jgi:hypothetical protein